MLKTQMLLISTLVICWSSLSFGAAPRPRIHEDRYAQAEVGESAARKYFSKRKKNKRSKKARTPKKQVEQREPASSGGRYLSLHGSLFLSEEVFNWGDPSNKDIGDWNAGVTYKMGGWENSMDSMFRLEFTSYSLKETRLTKMSILPLIVFPDLESGFPLYFGAGAGLGVFFKQVEKESSLTLDYQVFAGLRLMDLFSGVGLMSEVGFKNHLHLTSDGQFNGVYLSLGLAFEI